MGVSVQGMHGALAWERPLPGPPSPGSGSVLGRPLRSWGQHQGEGLGWKGWTSGLIVGPHANLFSLVLVSF